MSGLRDTSFLQNSINKNKGKGINMPPGHIEEVVKQHEEDLGLSKKIKSNIKYSLEENNVDLELENRIRALEEENYKLKEKVSGLTKNEEKILSAIRSEVINQSKDNPIIGRSLLINKYKVGSKYLDSSICGLEAKGYISRTPVKYSAKISTNSWQILKT